MDKKYIYIYIYIYWKVIPTSYLIICRHRLSIFSSKILKQRMMTILIPDWWYLDQLELVKVPWVSFVEENWYKNKWKISLNLVWKTCVCVCGGEFMLYLISLWNVAKSSKIGVCNFVYTKFKRNSIIYVWVYQIM